MLHVGSTLMTLNRMRHGGIGGCRRALRRKAQRAVAAALGRRGVVAQVRATERRAALLAHANV